MNVLKAAKKAIKELYFSEIAEAKKRLSKNPEQRAELAVKIEVERWINEINRGNKHERV